MVKDMGAGVGHTGDSFAVADSVGVAADSVRKILLAR